MTTQAHADLSNHDQNLSRARIAGYVLLAGLFLEVVVGMIWFKGLESMASLIAIAVVASGVAGEIFFESRARRSGKTTFSDTNTAEVKRAEHILRSPIARRNNTKPVSQLRNRERRKIPSGRARGSAAA